MNRLKRQSNGAAAMSSPILIVEDDQDLAEILEFNLKDARYRVETCCDGTDALARGLANDVALVVLDLMLPGMPGLDVCRELRTRKPGLPILVLTSLDSEMDRVLGLEIGADDYLTKPFSMREFQARVKALLRRSALTGAAGSGLLKPVIHCDTLCIDPQQREVTVGHRPIELTAKEFDLLYFLASNRGRVFSRDRLLDEIWGYSHAGYEHTVNTHINRLRNKLCEPAAFNYIQTVWGVGYKFVAPAGES